MHPVTTVTDAAPDDRALLILAHRTGEILQATQHVCGTAESCTGGYVSKLLTDVAGSSGWFDSGFVTYSNQAKQRMLGVPAELISKAGAVSAEVVQAMAKGALRHSGATVTTALSGVAGPDGGSLEKPVGTVWIAWAMQSGSVRAECFHFPGNRDAIRRAAAAAALHGIIRASSTGSV